MKIAIVGVMSMKKWFGVVLMAFLIGVLVLRYSFTKTVPHKSSPFSFFTDHSSEALHLEHSVVIQSSQPPESIDQVEVSSFIAAETLNGLFFPKKSFQGRESS